MKTLTPEERRLNNIARLNKKWLNDKKDTRNSEDHPWKAAFSEKRKSEEKKIAKSVR